VKTRRTGLPARFDVPHHRLHSDPPDRIESAPPRAGNSVLFQHNPPNADVHALPIISPWFGPKSPIYKP